jgi:hypothetical protein
MGEKPLPKVQTSRGFVAIEKIYNEESILTVFSVIGEIYNTAASERVLCENCDATRY